MAEAVAVIIPAAQEIVMVMEKVLLRERLLIAYTLYCIRQHDEILATLVLGP